MILKMSKGSRFYYSLIRIICFALIVGLIAPASSSLVKHSPTIVQEPPKVETARIHPALDQVIAQSPEATIRVIVQKQITGDSIEHLVANLGGEVVSDLHIINALSAEIAANAIPELAKANGIRWISLDAPVERTAVTLADDAPTEYPYQLMLPVIDTGTSPINTQDELSVVAAKKGNSNGKGKGNSNGSGNGNGKGKSNTSDSDTISTSTSEENASESAIDRCSPCRDNTYLETLKVTDASDMGLTGAGITIAVIDSGISQRQDFAVDSTDSEHSSRITAHIPFNDDSNVDDRIGHGTHVAGIISGQGDNADGLFRGIAPGANLISLNISNNAGQARESDAIRAMQWVLENKDIHNIRVVNMSINSTVRQPYYTSPLNAAAEILWFNDVVVVVSMGNKDTQNGITPHSRPPANDPFLITVGASTENGDSSRGNDRSARFALYKATDDGFMKPELYAPGVDVVSVLASNSAWEKEHRDRIIAPAAPGNGNSAADDALYFRASGNSMAAPMVSGAVALLLEAEPELTANQVKYRLIETAGTISANTGYGYEAKYLDVHAALTVRTKKHANKGIDPSEMLSTGEDPIKQTGFRWHVDWDSVNWDSVNWDSVYWDD